ncbi:MAG: LuxR C-terminal-related transcriptional regulator, partial [Candidatus Margulisiibacteriota bacterium]
LSVLFLKEFYSKLKYTFSLLPIFCFFSLYFSNHWFFFSIDLTKAALMPVYITSISLIFIIIWLTILFFDQSSEIHKQNLKDVLLTYQLSEREGEVFLHILNGKTNKFISENLFIEEGTVKNHLTNIYKKLSVKSRNELMAKFTG